MATKTTTTAHLQNGGIGLALAVIVGWGFSQFGGITMPPEVMTALGSVLTTVIALLGVKVRGDA